MSEEKGGQQGPYPAEAARPAGEQAVPGADVVLRAEGLTKAYHISSTPHTVVNGVSFSVKRGELVALMGPSGCGKSTLLHLVAGLEPVDGGRVLVNGKDITAMDERKRTLVR